MTLVDRISRFHVHWSHFLWTRLLNQILTFCRWDNTLMDALYEPTYQISSLSWSHVNRKEPIVNGSDWTSKWPSCKAYMHNMWPHNTMYNSTAYALAHRVMAIESNDKEQTSPLASLEARWPVKTRAALAPLARAREWSLGLATLCTRHNNSDQSWVLYRRAHYQNLYLIVTYRLQNSMVRGESSQKSQDFVESTKLGVRCYHDSQISNIYSPKIMLNNI